jgi:hypothetical protein
MPGWIALPANAINAAEIAPQRSVLSSRVLKVTAVLANSLPN